MDIWIKIYGHRIPNRIFGLEVDIKFKMGYWDQSLFWPQDPCRTRDTGPGDLLRRYDHQGSNKFHQHIGKCLLSTACCSMNLQHADTK